VKLLIMPLAFFIPAFIVLDNATDLRAAEQSLPVGAVNLSVVVYCLFTSVCVKL
jgi:hypothetical protein